MTGPLDKIRKLLALAGQKDSPEEAAVAYATERRLRYLEEGNDAFKRIHVEPAYVRSDPSKAIAAPASGR